MEARMVETYNNIVQGTLWFVAAAREEDFSRIGAAIFWDDCGFNGG